MPRPATIRAGVVGLGMGIQHAKACLSLPGVNLVAVAEPNPERFDRLKAQAANISDKAADAANAVVRYDTYQAMVKSADLDLVCLALPTDMHYDATAWCLKAGVNVLCEKPPTTVASQMKRLLTLAEDRGLTYAFVRQQRFQPNKFAVRELATSGRLGRITHAESHWLRSRGIPWRGGWGVNKDTGGGVLLDLGIHTIDDAWFVMGNPKPVSVFAGMHCGFDYLAETRNDLDYPYNADDHTVGLIRFDNGATLSTSASFAGNRIKSEDLDSDEVITNSEWLDLGVYGTKAGVEVGKQKLIKHHRDGVTVGDLKVPQRLAKMRTGFEGLIGDVADAIRTGRAPLNDAHQALQLMQMLDALKKSAETGKSVTIR